MKRDSRFFCALLFPFLSLVFFSAFQLCYFTACEESLFREMCVTRGVGRLLRALPDELQCLHGGLFCIKGQYWGGWQQLLIWFYCNISFSLSDESGDHIGNYRYLLLLLQLTNQLGRNVICDQTCKLYRRSRLGGLIFQQGRKWM